MVPFAVAPSPANIEQLPIECIVVGERVRTFSEHTVSGLAESLEVNGLVNPITVWRPNGGTEPHLIAGAHRLEAAKHLGWKLISCLVVAPHDHDRALLIEIDENLIRGELSPAERAVHIHRRKPLYERLHPETKHGGAPGKAGGGKETRDPNFRCFADDTAKKAGRSRSSVALDATRAKKIPNIAEVINTSLDKGEELDALAKLPAERQQLVIARAKAGEKVSAKPEAKKAKRQEREAELALKTEEASRALGGKVYGVIYADPPWRFEPYGEGGMDRAADNHYPTMAVEEIARLRVPAADNCVLFLWTTAPMLREALQVMDALGFTYRSNCVWAKDKPGTGHWFRSRHEHLLVGVKGEIPAPAPGEQYESIIGAAVGRHSEKPQDFAELIEKMFPSTPRVELFARTPRFGWNVWGNEVSALPAP